MSFGNSQGGVVMFFCAKLNEIDKDLELGGGEGKKNRHLSWRLSFSYYFSGEIILMFFQRALPLL